MAAGGRYADVFLVASIVWLGFAPGLTVAQESGGTTAEFRYSGTLVSEDSDVFFRNSADFSMSTATRRSRLSFSFGGNYELGLSGNASSNFDDPRADLSFTHSNGDQELSFDASVSRRDIETSVLQATALGFQVVVDEGQVENRSVDLRYAFGEDAPIGGSIELSFADQTYFDTVSTTLLDSETVSANMRLEFQFDPRVRARVTAAFSDLDRVGGTDVETLSFGVGATFDITKALVADIDVNMNNVKESGPGATPDREGGGADFSLTQTLKNGTLTGRISTGLGETGRVTSISIERDMQLRTGDFSAAVGYTFDDNDNESPTFDISYTHEFARAELLIAASQSFSAGNNGQELVNTRFDLRHSQELTATSSFDIGLSFRQSDFFAAAGNDVELIDLNFSYDQEITPDWSLIAGYSHIRRRDDSGTDTTDDEIFIGLQTTIGWRY
jgi:hypothetical protein